MGDVCQQCGNEYQKVGIHWSMSSSCSFPSFTNHQREIITGVLMGDGCISTANKHPYIKIEMISPNYLEHVADEFGVLGGGVSIKRTAKMSARRDKNSKFNLGAKEENYSDLYGWQSMSHPELREFANWYSSGEKIWPDDIELTPTVLKHWYCGDGSWNNGRTNNYISISMANEIDNTEKVGKMLRNVGLPTPSNYAVGERNDGSKTFDAQFTVEQSELLWEYMGRPLPDFEYKWPREFR